MPPHTKYCGRPSRWGNPFPVVDGNYALAVRLYRNNLTLKGEGFKVEIRRELRGWNLACWCPEDQPCHCDLLLVIANG